MTDRLVLVTADVEAAALVAAAAEETGVVSCNVYSPERPEDQHTIHLLVEAGRHQQMLDRIQLILGPGRNWRVTILPVEASLPRLTAKDEPGGVDDPRAVPVSAALSREELYTGVERDARLNGNFVFFVLLSGIVAAIGLIEDNVAVVIGAMVIAPLLGPNLAFALGVALGDRGLMLQALKTNLTGILLGIAIGVVIGLAWPPDLRSDELMDRTTAGFDSIVLALASGAAAALSLTAGASSALVGVMVAVALLPPAATSGLMLGSGHPDLALGALLLLAVNVVCVNLSAQVVFVWKKITPRTWLEKQNASRAVRINATLWLGLLAALALLLWLRSRTG